MKSKSFVEYGKLPKIQTRWKAPNEPEKEINRKVKIMNIIKRPRAYSEINRKFEIERSNKILLDKLIHIANRKTNYVIHSFSVGKRGMSQGVAGEKGNNAEGFLVYRMGPNKNKSIRGGSQKEQPLVGVKRRGFFRNNLKSNLPSLIWKKVNKEKAVTLADNSRKEVTDFTLEDDSSEDDYKPLDNV